MLLALTAPVALALPAIAAGERIAAPATELPLADDNAALSSQDGPLTQSGAIQSKREHLEALYAVPVHRQMRIEQRVVIRVAPQSRAPRSTLMAERALPRRAPRYIERKMDDCVAVSGITGVQPASGNRLVLHLKDRRLVSARLDKSCRARDFYSGFYVERNEDGKLCVARDVLQSRSGANCELTRIRELVEAKE